MRATEFLRAAGLLLGLCAALAAAPASALDATEPPVLVPSADGSEVINTKAGIAWARCVEGMQWSGRSCVGSPAHLDHAQALAAAAARRNADGKAWRLPRAPELKRMAGQWTRQRAQEPRAFPGAPDEWHWTASTTLDTSSVNPYDYGNIRRGVTSENVARIAFLHGWAVHTATGEADGAVLKRTRLAVRLVRSLGP